MQGAVPLRSKDTGSGGILYSARPTNTVSTPCTLLTLLALRQLRVGHVGSTEQMTCGSNPHRYCKLFGILEVKRGFVIPTALLML